MLFSIYGDIQVHHILCVVIFVQRRSKLVRRDGSVFYQSFRWCIDLLAIFSIFRRAVMVSDSGGFPALSITRIKFFTSYSTWSGMIVMSNHSKGSLQGRVWDTSFITDTNMWTFLYSCPILLQLNILCSKDILSLIPMTMWLIYCSSSNQGSLVSCRTNYTVISMVLEIIASKFSNTSSPFS